MCVCVCVCIYIHSIQQLIPHSLRTDPAVALHSVMERADEMKWTIKHWNDPCFDYSPHYAQRYEEGVERGEALEPCPTAPQRAAEAEEGESGGEEDGGVVGARSNASSAGAEEAQEQQQQEEEEQGQQQQQAAATAEAQRVLKKFKDLNINGAEYVPVFIPRGRPDLATARLPRQRADDTPPSPRGTRRVRAQHTLHRAFVSQQHAGLEGGEGREGGGAQHAAERRGGGGDRRGGVTVAAKISGAEKVSMSASNCGTKISNCRH